jgi:hypothetical protein
MMHDNSAKSAISILSADRGTRHETNRVFESIAALQASDLQVEVRRGFAGTLSDLGWIALGWLVLVVVIINPVVQLIGLLVCTIPLVMASAEPQSVPVKLRTERQVRPVSR